jgi:F-type H+-transporting ATPase subunit delta
MLSVIGSRYAKALAEIVTAPGSTVDPTHALEQLKAVAEMLKESVQLRNALLSPAVPASRKRAVMARVAEPLGVSPMVKNFLFVVIDHRRVGDFAAIVEAFEIQLDARLGYVRADVTSAHELNAAQRAGLEAELSRLSGKKAKLRFSTDSSLVAGAVARIASRAYDGSVRGQLDKLRVKLAGQ